MEIAQGTLTNSKHPLSFPDNIPPSILKGSQCYLWDKDGNRYIDYICALGSNIIGYASSEVNRVIEKTISNGNLFSFGSVIEKEFSRVLGENFPFIESIKILKSGSEGCSAAIRIARSYHQDSGRDLILSEGYHGWHDEFVSLTPPAVGINKEKGIKINLLKNFSIEKLYKIKPAAIIIEPISLDLNEARIEYLKELRKFCTVTNTVLIYDETITLFRFPKMLFSKYSEIYPDIVIFGKALANGHSISVVGGKKEIMEGNYFISTTFAGDTVPMNIAIELISLFNKGLEYNLLHLWNSGKKFIEEFNKLDVPDGVKIEGYPTRGIFVSKDRDRFYAFQQEAINSGVIFGSSWMYNFPLISENDNVLDICNDIFYKVKKGLKLKGRRPYTPISLLTRLGERI